MLHISIFWKMADCAKNNQHEERNLSHNGPLMTDMCPSENDTVLCPKS